MWLTFERVTVRYGVSAPVITGLDFRLGPGLWVVTGANGSGKTTLLRCAATLLRPVGGRLLWDGEDVWHSPARFRWHLGYAPQEVEEFPTLRVGEYLRYLAPLKGIRPAYVPSRVREMLSDFQLEDTAIHALSGGMKRSLALAAALLNDPDLLVLDEPLTSLDPGEKVRVRTLLGDLARQRIVLMSTHVLEEAAGIADGWLRVADKGVSLDVNKPGSTD